MEQSEVRALFPGAAERTYLNSAGVGIGSTRSAAAIAEFMHEVQHSPYSAHHGNYIAEARKAAATLINAKPHQIALTPATSLALQIVADAVPLKAGDNVVTDDLEFMSVVLPWIEKAKREGATLRVVRNKAGRVEAERIIGEIDDRTRAVVLSSVFWTHGYRLDLKPISEACRRKDVPLIVDAIQHLGPLPFDVEDCPVDYLTCGGHKWLTSPSALGFTYVSDGFASRFRPTLTYAPTAIPPTGSWLNAWLNPDYDPIQVYEVEAKASRFEMGVHHAALSAAGLVGALGIFNEFGPERTRKHVIALGDRLARGLQQRGFTVVSILEPEVRSGITAFRAGKTVEDDTSLRDFLSQRKVDVSVRFTSGIGGVRVSSHVYNSEGDIDRMLELCAEWQSGQR